MWLEGKPLHHAWLRSDQFGLFMLVPLQTATPAIENPEYRFSRRVIAEHYLIRRERGGEGSVVGEVGGSERQRGEKGCEIRYDTVGEREIGLPGYTFPNNNQHRL